MVRLRSHKKSPMQIRWEMSLYGRAQRALQRLRGKLRNGKVEEHKTKRKYQSRKQVVDINVHVLGAKPKYLDIPPKVKIT
jgi:hypothetical protein